mgnify:CR=1 FL=1
MRHEFWIIDNSVRDINLSEAISRVIDYFVRYGGFRLVLSKQALMGAYVVRVYVNSRGSALVHFCEVPMFESSEYLIYIPCREVLPVVVEELRQYLAESEIEVITTALHQAKYINDVTRVLMHVLR